MMNIFVAFCLFMSCLLASRRTTPVRHEVCMVSIVESGLPFPYQCALIHLLQRNARTAPHIIEAADSYKLLLTAFTLTLKSKSFKDIEEMLSPYISKVVNAIKLAEILCYQNDKECPFSSSVDLFLDMAIWNRHYLHFEPCKSKNFNEYLQDAACKIAAFEQVKPNNWLDRKTLIAGLYKNSTAALHVMSRIYPCVIDFNHEALSEMVVNQLAVISTTGKAMYKVLLEDHVTANPDWRHLDIPNWSANTSSLWSAKLLDNLSKCDTEDSCKNLIASDIQTASQSMKRVKYRRVKKGSQSAFKAYLRADGHVFPPTLIAIMRKHETVQNMDIFMELWTSLNNVAQFIPQLVHNFEIIVSRKMSFDRKQDMVLVEDVCTLVDIVEFDDTMHLRLLMSHAAVIILDIVEKYRKLLVNNALCCFHDIPDDYNSTLFRFIYLFIC